MYVAIILYTLFSKRNATLICSFSLMPLGHWPSYTLIKFWRYNKVNLATLAFGATHAQTKYILCVFDKTLIFFSVDSPDWFNNFLSECRSIQQTKRKAASTKLHFFWKSVYWSYLTVIGAVCPILAITLIRALALYSMVDESSDMLESGPTRKKPRHFRFFLFSPPTCPDIAPQTCAFAGRKHVKNTKI